MAIDFSKFNQQFPADQMKKAMKEAEENGGDFEKLPDGEYTTAIEKLELGESQKGALMLKAQFRIAKGDHKNQCIFVNKVLTGTKNDGFMLLQAKKFLESLDSGVDIDFDGWEDFADMLNEMLDAIKEDKLSYVLKLSENKKNSDYQDVEVVDILD